MKNLQEYLIESLYNHICCEMNSNYKFYEKFGIPEFVEKSTKEICDCISKYVDDISNIPEHINFDIDDVNIKLNIENVSKNVIANYDFENTDYKNSIITINLNIYKNDKFFLLDNFDSIESIIQHELLHAYEDLKRYESGKKLFSNIIDDSYTKSFYYVKYSKNKYNNIVSNIIYFLNDEERNAYFSQLKGDILESIKHLNMSTSNFSYNKLIQDIKDKPLWERYFEIGLFIEKLINNELTGYYKEFVYKEYNNINNSNFSDSYINKQLINKWKRFKNKFEQLVPKIICELLPHNNKIR